jgi:hypothetical protein
VAGHGDRRPEPRKKGRVLHCRLDDEHEPSKSRSTAQIRTYPFAGKFVKETLSFLVINPRSLAQYPESVFVF